VSRRFPSALATINLQLKSTMSLPQPHNSLRTASAEHLPPNLGVRYLPGDEPAAISAQEHEELKQLRAQKAMLESELGLAQALNARLRRGLKAIAEHKDQETSQLRKHWPAEYCCGYAAARIASGNIARSTLLDTRSSPCTPRRHGA
jgi:hypothetical protein